MKFKFWKKQKRLEEDSRLFDINALSSTEITKILKFGKASNIIAGFQSKPFIELPYGIIKKDLVAYQKQNLIQESIELIMQNQFEEFQIVKASGNEVISFLLWIREQQDFIQSIEKQNLSSDPEPEMLAAGINRLNDFGELVTIDSLAKGNILKHEEIEKLPYYQVYQKLKLDKTHKEIEKNYTRIKEEQAKQKK